MNNFLNGYRITGLNGRTTESGLQMLIIAVTGFWLLIITNVFSPFFVLIPDT